MKRVKTSLGLYLCMVCMAAVLAGGIQTAQAFPTIPDVTVTDLNPFPEGAYVKSRDTGGSCKFDGQNVIVFGDTDLSQANSDGLTWINNSMFHVVDSAWDNGISGGYNFKESGEPARQWVPNTTWEASYNAFHNDKYVVWPGPFFTDPNLGRTYVFFDLAHVEGTTNYGDGYTGFARVQSLTSVCSRLEHRPSDPAPSNWTMWGENGHFGNGTCVTSNLYVYAYFVDGADWGKAYIARAPLASEGFKTKSNWKYWDGTGWANSIQNKQMLFTDTGSTVSVWNRGSVAWNGYLGCYLWTYMEWNGFGMPTIHVQMRVADDPWGPWSAAKNIFTVNGDKYSATAHPAVEQENGRTQFVTYSETGGEYVRMKKVRFN